jgi:NAD(P)-dependent dehydrogenase (short-subunit alcohol dehydrogenase family)
MPAVLITGASRGVGAALAGEFGRQGWQVYATCRDVRDADELDGHIAAGVAGQIEKLALDVADFAAIEQLATDLSGVALDVLLLNAAVTGGPTGAFGATDFAAWDRCHRVNTQAPMKLAECFAPHVRASRRRVIFAISSRVGPAPEFGHVGYRASKSALNQVILQLSLALAARGICCACAHPGWVRTRATGLTGALSAAESAQMLYTIVDRLTLADSGTFFDPDGSRLPIVTQQHEARSYSKRQFR